jgi:hypothetical protein
MPEFVILDQSQTKKGTRTLVSEIFSLSQGTLDAGKVSLNAAPEEVAGVTGRVSGYLPMENKALGFVTPDFEVKLESGTWFFYFKGAGLSTGLPPADSKLIVTYNTLTIGADVQTDPNAVATAIMDRLLAGHTNEGSLGKAVKDILDNSGGISNVPEAVWDRLLAGHTDSGSAGKHLTDLASPPSADTIANAVWDKSLTAGKASDLLEFLYNVESGRWKIDTSTKELILFKPDNVTELTRFDLKGANGAANAVAPFERVKK